MIKERKQALETVHYEDQMEDAEGLWVQVGQIRAEK